ncbi:MAG: tetratricopeptide repeat protein, partial [Terriglobales bacterium]
ARDWVLIASFDNRTGEPVFDGVLEYALERELSNSRFVNVAPRERMNDALALMRKPLDTKVDAALGREVCLRDGGIRGLISGRVEKLDTTYLLSASLVNPTDGVTAASFSEEAAGQKEVVPALRRLSGRVRRALGEELSAIRQSEQKLEKVTTPSLRALQLFSRADALIVLEGYVLVRRGTYNAAAEGLLKQAVAEDPQFASAYTHLAWTIRNQGRPESEYRAFAERARELSASASERERYFILGSYHQQLGQRDKAIPYYEALLRLYPDHFWAANNMAGALRSLGRADEALPYLVARAEMRPNDFVSAYEAWEELDRFRKDPARAQHFLEQARRLASSSRDSAPEAWTHVQFQRLDELLGRGELPQAVNELERLAGSTNTLRGPTRESWLVTVADYYQEIGRLQTAEKYLQMLPENLRYWPLAALAEFKGDRQAFRRHLKDQITAAKDTVGAGTAARLARAGMLAESQVAIAQLTLWGVSPLRVQYARGELALARGQISEAVKLLRNAFEASVKNHDVYVPLISEAYARALQAKGDLPAAIQVVEQGWDQKPGSRALDRVQHKNQLRLLYRKLGKEQEAQQIEAELLKLLAYADEDHPILRELKRQQGTGASTAKP